MGKVIDFVLLRVKIFDRIESNHGFFKQRQLIKDWSCRRIIACDIEFGGTAVWAFYDIYRRCRRLLFFSSGVWSDKVNMS